MSSPTNLGELLNEEYGRLSGQLTAEHRRLRVVLGGVLAVAIIFFALGFVPYVTNQAVVLDVAELLAVDAGKVQELRKQRKTQEELESFYESYRGRFQSAREEIQESLNRADFPEVRFDLEFHDPENLGFKRFHQLVMQKSRALFRQVKGHRHEARLMSAELLKDLEARFAAFDAVIRGDPEPWKALRHGSMGHPEDENYYLFDFAASMIDQWSQEHVVGEIRSIDKSLAVIAQRERTAIEERTGRQRTLEEVRALANLDTPLGKLPLGFVELILFFPLLCMVAYALLRSRQRSAETLHDALISLAGRRDPSGSVLGCKALALSGHGGLDRTTRSTGRVARLAAIGVMPGLALAALGFLASHDRVLDELLVSGRLALSGSSRVLGFALAVLAVAALAELGIAAFKAKTHPESKETESDAAPAPP